MILSKNRALFVILLSIPLGGVGIDLYSPALPALAADFGVSPAIAKMTMSLFLMGSCLGQIVLSPFSDAYGRKPLQIFGTLLYMVSSLLISMTSSFAWVLGLRLLQGMGAGVITATVRTQVSDIYDRNEIRLMSSYISIAWSLGPIIAPWIGGYIQHYWGWHYCFYFYALYGFIALGAHIFLLPETNKNPAKLQFIQIARNYKIILADEHFFGALLFMGLSYAILVIFGMVGPFLLQSVMGYTAIAYGYMALIIGMGYFLGTLLRRGLHRFLEKNLVFIALACMSITVVLGLIMVLIWPGNLYAFCAPIIIICSSLGILFPICLGRCISLFPNMAGAASALCGFGTVFIASVVSFVIGLIKINSTLHAISLYAVMILLLWMVLYKFLNKHI